MPFAKSHRGAGMHLPGSGLLPASQNPRAATIPGVFFIRAETPGIEGRPIAAMFTSYAYNQARAFRFGDDAYRELK